MYMKFKYKAAGNFGRELLDLQVSTPCSSDPERKRLSTPHIYVPLCCGRPSPLRGSQGTNSYYYDKADYITYITVDKLGCIGFEGGDWMKRVVIGDGWSVPIVPYSRTSTSKPHNARPPKKKKKRKKRVEANSRSGTTATTHILSKACVVPVIFR